MKALVIALAAARCRSSACTPHTTEATEVGVRFNKITRSTEVDAARRDLFLHADRQ